MEEPFNVEDYLLLTVGDFHYAAWPDPKGLELDHRSTRSLVTVIQLPPVDTVSQQWLQAWIHEALQSDDVFQVVFLSGVVFTTSLGQKSKLDFAVQSFLEEYGNQWIEFVDLENIENALLPGPYILEKGRLRRVWRLHEDSTNAFIVPFQPGSNFGAIERQYRPLQIGNTQYQSRSVAVPSRLCALPSVDKPFAGIRICVKDLFQIQGFRTSLCNRAYLELYPPATRTAPAIQKLIEGGAHILGLTALNSLVLSRAPTQCIDFQDPFNPRADGYQSPSGGSSGQAASVAAYDWLDVAIGSDATFSGRMPAQANGCFSMRPSRGAVSLDGMWSSFTLSDTPCFFGRDISAFKAFAGSWYGDHLTPPIMKHDIGMICLSEFHPDPNELQMCVYESFVTDLQKYLQVRPKKISLSKLWEEQPPSKVQGEALHEYLKDVATRSYAHKFWNRVETFYNKYQEMFNKLPFLDPPGVSIWDRSRNVTPQQHEDALGRLQVYEQWLKENVLHTDKQIPVIVMPLREVKPTYRDEWPIEEHGDQPIFDPLLLAPTLGAPELVVPAGQIPFNSRISARQEYLPVCVSVTGAPGSDLELIDLIHGFLIHSGRPTIVLTGRMMFKDTADRSQK